MKRLLIGVVAVAGLLGSVLALVASASSPASGQQASISLLNTSTSSAAVRALPAAATSISVTIETVSGCNPGARAPLSNGQFNLPVATTDGTGGTPEITGLISTNCNWQISYTNFSCEVSVTVKDSGDSTIGDVVTNGRPIVLSGVNTGGGSLQYQGTTVASIEFSANFAGSGGLLLGSTSTAPGMRCVSSFSSSLSLAAAGNVTAAHAGLEITATYTSTTTGCIGGSLVNRVTAAGGLQFVSASPAQARGIGGLLNGVSLISETVAQKTSPATATAGDRCIYSVTVTDTLGNLRLARTAFGQVDPSKTTNLVDGIAISGTANAFLAGSTNTDIIPNNVTVTYSTYRVAVTVTTTYPSDEVFTTDDTVTYVIAVNSPCGGFNRAIPAGFGVQGESASVRVYPGSVTVYGSGLRSILNTGVTKTFDAPAFFDARGTQPCSVTVTENDGPERCSPVGGASRTQSVSAGSAALSFEFTHTCEPVGATSSGGDVSVGGTTGGTDTPPAPPSIDLGGGTTTAPSGPAPEGRTG